MPRGPIIGGVMLGTLLLDCDLESMNRRQFSSSESPRSGARSTDRTAVTPGAMRGTQ
jgi:hypothetical protein